ncbi:hypothetical protein [Peptostreptococcus stomatis]|uniref:hypothetical protein n=1 Tax=Peptostreptococcus stomatis TaxID=341694 RepID=UPI0024A7B811|nr:hypothetical protein [Peptostreptococcus stomatis]
MSNIKFFIIFIVSLVLANLIYFIFKKNGIDVNIGDTNIIVGVITVSTVLCGFSINNLAMLVDLCENGVLKNIKGTNIIRDRNRYLIDTIIVSSLTFIFSIVVLMIKIIGLIDIVRVGYLVIFILQIFSWYFFIKSSKKLYQLTEKILKNNEKITEEDINKYSNVLENSTKHLNE